MITKTLFSSLSHHPSTKQYPEGLLYFAYGANLNIEACGVEPLYVVFGYDDLLET
jgi:hypothetical protein